MNVTSPDNPASPVRWPAWPDMPFDAVGLSAAQLVYELQSTALICVLTPKAGASKRAAVRLWRGFVEQARQRGLVDWRLEGLVALCGDERELGPDDRDALMLGRPASPSWASCSWAMRRRCTSCWARSARPVGTSCSMSLTLPDAPSRCC